MARSKTDPREEHFRYVLERPHRLGQLLGYDRLTDLHSDWILYLFNRDEDVALQAHRNSYKTTCIVVGLIWSGLVYPERTILLLRKTATDAEKTLQEVARHYDRPELRGFYRAVLGVSEPRGDPWLKKSLTLALKKGVTKEGNFEAAGIGDSVTGAHYHKIIADDIVTLRDRVSRAERERTKSFFRELHNVKIADSGTISVSGTPWARDDAFSIMPPAVRYPWKETGIISKSRIAQLKKQMPLSLFAANYDLIHIDDEEKLFTDPQFSDWPKSQPVAFLDPAYGGGANTSLAIGARDKKSETIVVRGRTWQADVVKIKHQILAELDAWRVGTLYVEGNADKGSIARDLGRHRPAVVAINNHVNKHIRIVHRVRTNWQSIRFAHDCDDQFLANILDYQEGEKPDDEADALAGLLEKLPPKHSNRSFILGDRVAI